MRSPRLAKSGATARTVWLVVILAIAFELVLIPAFTLIQRRDIEQRASEALEAALSSSDDSYSADLPDVYFVYSDELQNHMLYGAGAELGKYVLQHKDELVPGKTLRFGEGDNILLYRMAEGSSLYGEPDDPRFDLLFAYCDLGFAYGVMHRTVGVMIVVAAVTAAALVFAGRAATRAIARRDQMQRAFFANASHELKTPLMTIQGNTCGMRDGYIGTKEGCDAIDAASDRMVSLVGDILDLSRVDAGAVEPHREACDVREIVYDALGAVQIEASKRGVELDVDLPTPLPHQCDERMTFTIVSNVIANGVRHAASVLHVSARKDASNAICVRVVNDGTPITDKDCAHAFDRFYCGEQGQTGIGLSLAQEYANLQGGTLFARPLPNGTEFSITLT